VENLCKTFKRLAESWKFEEATNGEAVLLLCEVTSFDVIFVDQYMMSLNGIKPLPGTETVREMLARGVMAQICSLSANNVEQEFLENGADLFMRKPFPGEKEALRIALWHILYIQP
jgi:CheY-like chemotaxis protein